MQRTDTGGPTWGFLSRSKAGSSKKWVRAGSRAHLSTLCLSGCSVPSEELLDAEVKQKEPGCDASESSVVGWLQQHTGSSASGGVWMGFLSPEKSWAMQGGAAYLLHLHVGGGAGRVFRSRMKSVPWWAAVSFIPECLLTSGPPLTWRALGSTTTTSKRGPTLLLGMGPAWPPRCFTRPEMRINEFFHLILVWDLSFGFILS